MPERNPLWVTGESYGGKCAWQKTQAECEHVWTCGHHVESCRVTHHRRALVGLFHKKRWDGFCFWYMLAVSEPRLFFASGHGLIALMWWFFFASIHKSLRYVPNVAYEIQLRNELPLKGVIIGDLEAMALEVVRIIRKWWSFVLCKIVNYIKQFKEVLVNRQIVVFQEIGQGVSHRGKARNT